jgi:DNA-binding HxlR family transcriptional regulator
MPRRRAAASAPSATAARPDPLRSALDRVGDRWILLVVDALSAGPQRFGDLAEQVGAAPNILTERLRRLEVEGLVVATPYSTRPRRLDYRLTESGRGLADALVALAAWGADQEGVPALRFHAGCGSAIELRPWCPTCDRPVAADELPGTYDL